MLRCPSSSAGNQIRSPGQQMLSRSRGLALRHMLSRHSSNRQMPGQNQTGPSFSHHDHTYVTNPTVVPRNYFNVDFGPNIVASSFQPDHISVTAAASPSQPRPGPGGLATVRRQAPATNLSEEAKSLLQKSRRDSSQSTYKTPGESGLAGVIENKLIQ